MIWITSFLLSVACAIFIVLTHGDDPNLFWLLIGDLALWLFVALALDREPR